MMMGERQVDQSTLFYEFSLEKHVPADHMLRAIDPFVDLGEVRPHLAPFYSTTGQPSVIHTSVDLLDRVTHEGGIEGMTRSCRDCLAAIGWSISISAVCGGGRPPALAACPGRVLSRARLTL